MEKSQQLEPNVAGTVAASIGIYNGHPLPHCYFIVCCYPSCSIVHNKHGSSTANGSIQLDLVSVALANCFEETMKLIALLLSLGFFSRLAWELRSCCHFLSFFSKELGKSGQGYASVPKPE